MTTANLYFHQIHLRNRSDLYNSVPWMQSLLNSLNEAGQVISGALHIIPAPPQDLNPALQRDLGL